MNILFQYFIYSACIGIGATMVMDVYALLIKHLFNIPSLDYAVVGRWVGHFKKGIFIHQTILQAKKIKGERFLGWISHYIIGISFAFLLLLICGIEWLHHPTFWSCIVLGLASTAAPWFIMQPAFGFGIAASKTPKPTISRLRSLQAHLIYGLGLYLTAIILKNTLF